MVRSAAVGLTCLLSLCASPLAGQRLRDSVFRAEISGVLFDSIGHGPLIGASVQFVGLDSVIRDRVLATTTDSLGEFSLTAPPGRYLAGFFHPAVDTLGIELRSTLVEISLPSTRIRLATPSTATVIRTVCRSEDSAATERRGLIFGHVHDAGTEQAIADAAVTFRWPEAVISGGAVSAQTRSVTVRTRSGGWFALCDLPADVALSIQAARGAESSGSIDLEVPVGEFRHLTLFVPTVGAGEGSPSGRAVGSAKLRGQILNEARQPVPLARVSIVGTGRDTVTSSDGSFALSGLPSGTRMLAVQAIGYAPKHSIVHLLDRSLVQSNAMLDRITALPTVLTRAEMNEQRLDTFLQHQRSGAGGFYLRPPQIDGATAQQSPHLLMEALPGVIVKYGRGEWSVFMTRPSAYLTNGQKEVCTPRLFVNGRLSSMSFDEIDHIAELGNLIGVEVYSRDAQIPAQYGRNIADACGLVAFWVRD